MPLIWIEIEGERIDADSVQNARAIILKRWPQAVVKDPIYLGRLTLIHIHRVPRERGDLHGPDAVIVSEFAG